MAGEAVPGCDPPLLRIAVGMRSSTKLAALGVALTVVAATPATLASPPAHAHQVSADAPSTDSAPPIVLGSEFERVVAEAVDAMKTSLVDTVQRYQAPDDITTPPLVRGTYSVLYEPKISYPVPMVPIASGFGRRHCADGPCTTFHAGIDFASAEGTPVKSIASGVVTFAGVDGNHGNRVVIDHNVNGEVFTSAYSHLQSIAVHPGQPVARGAHIGNSGQTGRSYGAHLHFELHLPGVGPIDAATWFATHRTQPYPG